MLAIFLTDRMLYPTKVRMLIPRDEDDVPAYTLLPPMSTEDCAPKEGWRQVYIITMPIVDDTAPDA